VAWWDRGPREDVGKFTRNLIGIWHSKQRLHCPIHPYERWIENFSNEIQLLEGPSQAPSHCDVLACEEAGKEKFCPSYVLIVNRGPPSDKVNVSDDKLDIFQKMTYPVRDSCFWTYLGNDCSWNCLVIFSFSHETGRPYISLYPYFLKLNGMRGWPRFIWHRTRFNARVLFFFVMVHASPRVLRKKN
jgi:hypothetical protein